MFVIWSGKKNLKTFNVSCRTIFHTAEIYRKQSDKYNT
jgi:hypothetical protein